MNSTTTIRILLRDREPTLAEAWSQAFDGVPNVSISCGDIFDVVADAIVSPANSFGFMDGGIDAVYSAEFGTDLQTKLQRHLAAEHGGELPVGAAAIIGTGSPAIPWLVSAPTMRIPGPVPDTVNAYLAFRAALRTLADHNRANPERTIRSLLCPGLATAIGGMPAQRCARQMRMAHDAVLSGVPWPGTAKNILTSHHGMLS